MMRSRVRFPPVAFIHYWAESSNFGRGFLFSKDFDIIKFKKYQNGFVLMKHLIFDMDDTILASKDSFAKTIQTVARELEVRIPSVEEISSFGHWNEYVKDTWPGLDMETYKLAHKRISETIPYSTIPNANETLEYLSQNNKLYVLSKRPKEMLDLRVGQARLKVDLFELILCREDTKYSKPDPRSFEEVTAFISRNHPDFEASDLFYIGDHLDDYVAARDANIEFFAVKTGNFGEVDFSAAGLSRDNILRDINDLTEIF